MRKYVILLALLTVLVAVGLTWQRLKVLGGRKGTSFRGQTTSQWESEIRHWRVTAGCWSNKFGSWTSWSRQTPVWLTWLEKAGFRFEQDHSKLPLLEGDPAAIPVLVELLQSSEPNARRIAAQGLEAIGPTAKEAGPALVKALDDPDEEVRRNVEQALFTVDQDAAEKAGLEWSILGLVRHAR